MAKVLTDTELGVMNTLWSIDQGTVRDIHAALGRDVAYTTVATLLKILEKKAFVQSQKQGRTLVYQPLVTQESYQQTGLSHLMQRVFGGDPIALMRTLVGGQNLSEEELASLEAMVDKAQQDAS